EDRSPGGRGRLPGTESNQTLTVIESIGRAGHRFGSESLPGSSCGQSVSCVDLDQREGAIDPDRSHRTVGPGEPGPSFAIPVPDQVAEGEIDFVIPDPSCLQIVEGGTGNSFAAGRKLALV